MLFNHLVRVACFTIVQAACSTLVALLIGLPFGFFCAKRKFWGQKILLSLSAVPFCAPSLLVALGYVTFLGLNGGLNQFLMFIFGLKEPPVKFLYSFFGLIIAHGFYNFPLIMKTVCDAWEHLPPQPEESARLLGASDFRIFRTITIYQLLPSVASSGMITFIYCFLSFILVLLFGGIGNSTLEVEIYKAARGQLDFNKAFLLSMLETCILLVFIFLYCRLEQKAIRSKGLKKNEIYHKQKISNPIEIVFFVILLFLLIVFFIAPMLGIFFNAFTSYRLGNQINFKFTTATFQRIFKMKSFLPSLWTTLLCSTASGLLCTIIGFIYSVFLNFIEYKQKPRLNAFLSMIPLIPMTASSVVVGLFLTSIIKNGTFILLICTQALLFWPIGFKQINNAVQKIPSKTLDCAILLSRNKFNAIVRVILPSVKTQIFSAFCFSFAICAGDTTLPLVLAIPKFSSLSLFTYRLAGAYRFNEACASGIILGLICFMIFSLGTNSLKKLKGLNKCHI